MDIRWLNRTRYEVRSAINRSPGMFAVLSRIQPRYRSVRVSPDTDIVIEGFPRSGNTFAVVALQLVQERPLSISRHTHAPAQILSGVRHGKPALVLIRDPIDAVVSLLLREPALSSAQVLRSYAHFYNAIYPYRASVVVATFGQVTNSFDGVVAKLNETFGTAFASFEHSDENIRRCFMAIERMESQDSGKAPRETHVARPSAYRDDKKEVARLRVIREKRLLDQAYGIFGELSRLAEGHK